MAVTVKVTETFDMKTTVGKLGVIGIHTPTGEQIRRLYPGLVKNHKFIRFVKCDVVGACASVLPADPLQVGVSAGDVAPEDMFNPILYTACSNESFDSLLSKIYKATDVNLLGSVNEETQAWTESDAFNMYYSLLSENGKYKKAMPQSGFSIKNLVPICHTLLSTYGNVGVIGNEYVLSEDGETPVPVPDLTDVKVANGNMDASTAEPLALTFRGKPVRMPKLPLHKDVEAWDAIPSLNIPKLFVAGLIVPPARLHEFWYRMRVSWYVRFENVCSSLEAGNGTALNSIGQYSYGRDYTIPSSKSVLDNEESTVDTNDVTINKIMES